MIHKLDWDSDFFGITIGRSDFDCASVTDLETMLAQKKQSGYDLLYVFLNTPPDSACADWFRLNGGMLVDEKVIYEKRVPVSAVAHANVSEYTGAMTQELCKLALESGHSSRFKIDPKLNHKFEAFYTVWMQKSVDKILADKIFVYRDNGNICGFVTIKVKERIGQIGLIAVDEQVRGRGIGKALIAACDRWLIGNGITKHQVVTQLQNTGACALYEKCGFVQASVQPIYHI